MSAALTRYRAVAYVVGVVLIALVLVAVPMKYLGGDPTLVGIVGPIHGFLYMVYLVVSYDLARRTQWRWGPTILLFLAGTVPFVSFAAERRVTRLLTGPPVPSGDATG